MDIKKIFSTLEDPRIDRKKLHLLDDILGLTLLAVLCGADGWEAIELFGKSKKEFLRQVLELPNGIPSHDTIERLFQRLDSRKFEEAFMNWVKGLEISTSGKIISIDGKTLRGSRDEGNGRYAIHLVSAWCGANSISLGQIKTQGKSNEINAVKELLTLLDISGSVITIDAMGCQRDIAEQIVENGADYILAVKDNQKKLKEEIMDMFEFSGALQRTTQTEKDHGRIETRTCSIIKDLGQLQGAQNWRGLKTIIKIESKRVLKNKTTSETRYYISSIDNNAEYFNHTVRSHWGIENSYHWVLDVQMGEDADRKRKNNSAENFAIIRRVALAMLQNKQLRRLGVKNKQLVAGWDHAFLLSLLDF